MQHPSVAFEKDVATLGSFSLVPFDLDCDVRVIHPWVNMEYASFWMLGNSSEADVRAEYTKILSTGHTEVLMGYYRRKPVFLAEVYDPRHEEIGTHIDPAAGDYGMHVLVGPPDEHIPNFTSGVFYLIMSFLFEARQAKRVFVEPDIGNAKIHKLNRRFGFRVLQERVQLANKTAQLELCLREDFERCSKVLGF